MTGVQTCALPIFQYAGQDVVPVPGTGGMLSASATRAREIASAADAVRRATEPGDALVVIPEGQVLNEITGRRNPLRQKLYIPGYLTDENEAAVLEDFVRRRPRAIVIWYRPTSEYGPSLFGHGYGMRVMSWIRENYAAPVPTMPRSLNRLYLLRRPADPAAPANGPPR